jgi:hypothetical protein
MHSSKPWSRPAVAGSFFCADVSQISWEQMRWVEMFERPSAVPKVRQVAQSISDECRVQSRRHHRHFHALLGGPLIAASRRARPPERPSRRVSRIVNSTTVPIATGWSEPGPCRICALSGPAPWTAHAKFVFALQASLIRSLRRQFEGQTAPETMSQAHRNRALKP